MNTQTFHKHTVNNQRRDFVRVAIIDIPGDNRVVIDWNHEEGFLAFFDGGVWPDGDDHKIFDSLSAAMREAAMVIEDYLEETGEVYSEEYDC